MDHVISHVTFRATGSGHIRLDPNNLAPHQRIQPIVTESYVTRVPGESNTYHVLRSITIQEQITLNPQNKFHSLYTFLKVLQTLSTHPLTH